MRSLIDQLPEDPEEGVAVLVNGVVEAFEYDGTATDTFKGFSGAIYTAELWYRMDEAGIPRWQR